MKQEIITLNKERNVTLTAYLQQVGGEFPSIPKRPAILVLPGGGYTMCSERETDPVAWPYLEAGYQVFILRYSIGHDAIWPGPMNDLEQAMALIRAKEEEWNLYPDKLAVVGFSAGGHLAGCAATMAKERANAAILVYAALDGEHIKQYHPTAPDVIGAVDKDTCPCFLATSRTDNMVPVRSTAKMTLALIEHDISFESHIYSFGPHGFSICNSSVLGPNESFCNRIPNWVADSIEWLKEVFGDFGPSTMTKPLVGRHINGNYEPTLNVDCTMAYLMSKSAAAAVIGPIMQGSGEDFADLVPQPEDPLDPRMNSEHLMEMMTLRNILAYGQAFGSGSSDPTEQIDAILHQIPNV